MPLAMKLQPPVFSNMELAWMAAHTLFMVAAAVGFILLIVWMAKNLKGKQLLRWVLIFIIVGLLGSALTFRYEMDFWGKFVWGGTMSGNWGDGKTVQTMMPGSQMMGNQMMPLRHESMNQMMTMMYQVDKACETADCQNEVKTIMAPMMEQMEDYMENRGMMAN